MASNFVATGREDLPPFPPHARPSAPVRVTTHGTDDDELPFHSEIVDSRFEHLAANALIYHVDPVWIFLAQSPEEILLPVVDGSIASEFL